MIAAAHASRKNARTRPWVRLIPAPRQLTIGSPAGRGVRRRPGRDPATLLGQQWASLNIAHAVLSVASPPGPVLARAQFGPADSSPTGPVRFYCQPLRLPA